MVQYADKLTFASTPLYEFSILSADTYNKKVKLIKSNSNLKIQNKQAIYYNIDIIDEKIYEYI